MYPSPHPAILEIQPVCGRGSTPPVLAAGPIVNSRWLKGPYASLGDLLVLVHGAAADADGACHLAVARQRDAAGEDDDASIVGRVEAEECLSGLRHVREVLRGHLERN